MEQISPEIFFDEIIERLPVSGIIRLCSTNKYFAEMCDNKDVWRHLSMKYFPDKTKESWLSWRKHFMLELIGKQPEPPRFLLSPGYVYLGPDGRPLRKQKDDSLEQARRFRQNNPRYPLSARQIPRPVSPRRVRPRSPRIDYLSGMLDDLD